MLALVNQNQVNIFHLMMNSLNFVTVQFALVKNSRIQNTFSHNFDENNENQMVKYDNNNSDTALHVALR